LEKIFSFCNRPTSFLVIASDSFRLRSGQAPGARQSRINKNLHLAKQPRDKAEYYQVWIAALPPVARDDVRGVLVRITYRAFLI